MKMAVSDSLTFELFHDVASINQVLGEDADRVREFVREVAGE